MADGRILRAVKLLAVALMGDGSADELTEETIAEALENLAENYQRPADGKSAYEIWVDEGNVGDEQDFLDSLKGDPGLSVTAIELTVDGDGKVTGGKATLSDDSEITITVTEDTET
jgi:hypothetical protein